MGKTTTLGAFIFGGLAFLGIAAVTGFPAWLVNSQESSEEFLRNQEVYHGIWWRCISVKQGTFQCDTYDSSILGLPADIQACRALMCIATISGFFATMLALLSLDCTTMVEPETKGKNRIAFISGCCYLISALCCGIAVSWYAWKVVYEFTHPLYQQQEFKYEFGACLYIGWVSMLFSLISGLILMSGSCRRTSNDDEYPTYGYNPPTSQAEKKMKQATEYV